MVLRSSASQLCAVGTGTVEAVVLRASDVTALVADVSAIHVADHWPELIAENAIRTAHNLCGRGGVHVEAPGPEWENSMVGTGAAQFHFRAVA